MNKKHQADVLGGDCGTRGNFFGIVRIDFAMKSERLCNREDYGTTIPADEPVRADDRKTMVAVACGISRIENDTEAVMNDVRDGWNLL